MAKNKLDSVPSKTRVYTLADPENDLFSDAMDRAVSMYHSVRHGAMRNAERAGEGHTMDGERLARTALAAGFKAYLEEIGPTAPETCEQRTAVVPETLVAWVDERHWRCRCKPPGDITIASASFCRACGTARPELKALEQPADQWVQDGKVWDEQTIPPAPVMQARFCDYKGPLVERDGKMVCPKCGNS